MRKIELESRWDIFKVPIDELPDGQFLAVGKDNWFLTSKQFMSDYKKLNKELEHILMYGTKYKGSYFKKENGIRRVRKA